MRIIYAKGLTKKEYLAKYRIEHPERYKGYRRKYRLRLYQWRKENPEKIRAIGKRYYYKNRKRRILSSRLWYKNNKQRVIDRNTEWRKRNIDKVKVYRHNREILEKKSIKTGTINEFAVKELKNTQNDFCALCGKRMFGKYTLDHIFPLSKGGYHEIYNIQLVHRYCNSMKSNKVSEKDIQKAVGNYLTYVKVFWYRQNSGMIFSNYKGKERAFRAGVIGAPDIIAVINGIYVGIEIKNSKGKLSEHQVKFRVNLIKAGGEYWVIKSLEDIENAIRNLDVKSPC